MAQIYDAGISPDWWKLPAPQSDAEWQAIEHLIATQDPHCRGVLLLGLDAPEEVLVRGFRLAASHGICKGFAVGRSIFGACAARWFANGCSDEEVVDDIAQRYSRLIDQWRGARGAARHSKE